MPILRFKDRTTGRTVAIDWNGPGEPTEADIERLGRPVLTPQPGMEPVTSLSKPVPPPAPEEFEPGIAGVLRNTIARPIVEQLGPGAQAAVGRIDQPSRAKEEYEQSLLSTGSYEGLPPSTSLGFMRGVAENVTPGQVAAAASFPVGGPISTAANLTLGAEGALAATDPEAGLLERGLGALQGVAGGLFGIRGLRGARDAFQARFPGSSTPPPKLPTSTNPTRELMRDQANLAAVEKWRAGRQSDAAKELLRDQQNLADVEKWAKNRRAIKTAKAGLTEQEPTVRRTLKAGDEAVTTVWSAADDLEDAVTPSGPRRGGGGGAPAPAPAGPVFASREEAIAKAKELVANGVEVNVEAAPGNRGFVIVPSAAPRKAAQAVVAPTQPVVAPNASIVAPTTPASQTGGVRQQIIEAELAAERAKGVPNNPVAQQLETERRAIEAEYAATNTPPTQPLTANAPVADAVPDWQNIDQQTAEVLEYLAARRGSGAVPTTPAASPAPVFTEAGPPTRIDEALRSNPRFQALDEAERARRYRELGGLSAEFGKATSAAPAAAAPPTPPVRSFADLMQQLRAAGYTPDDIAKMSPDEVERLLTSTPEPPVTPPRDMRPRLRKKGIDDQTGEVATELLAAPFTNPIGRAAIGGTIGYNTDDENSYRNAFLGAIAGAGAAPARYGGAFMKGAPTNPVFWRNLSRLQYEAMLAGLGQVSNLAGNVGGLMTGPIIEGARGNTAGAVNLYRSYSRPETWRSALRGLKSGYAANTLNKMSGELPAGPSTRTLNAVDRAAKNVLEAGGLTPRQAEIFTVSGRPVTPSGQVVQQIVEKIPAMRLLAPFTKTLVNQLELGAALSPMRYMGKHGEKLSDLIPIVPSRNPAVSAARHLATAGAIPAAGVASGYYGFGPDSPQMAALTGAFQPHYVMGRAIRDYQMFGQGREGELAQAMTRQAPFFAEYARTLDNPSRFPGQVLSRFIPPILYAVGDRQLRDPRGSTEAYLRERLPWTREDLPLRRDPFGNIQMRDIGGGYPQQIYERNPTAAALGDLGLLRRNVAIPSGLPPDVADKLTERKGGMIEEAARKAMAEPGFDRLPLAVQRARVRLALQSVSQVNAMPPGLRAILQSIDPDSLTPEP